MSTNNTDDGDPPQIQTPDTVDDSEDATIQRKRIQGLQQVREDTFQAFFEIFDLIDDHTGDTTRGRQAFHRQLQRYILQHESLMRVVFPGVGEEYWNEQYLGQGVVQPPEELVENGVDPYTYDISGLGTIVNLEPQQQHRFEYESTGFGGRRVQDSITVEYALSPQILKWGFRSVNNFRAQIGLELQRNDTTDYELKYEDLL